MVREEPSGGPYWEGLDTRGGSGDHMAWGSCGSWGGGERPVRRLLLWTKQEEMRLELERREVAWK